MKLHVFIISRIYCFPMPNCFTTSIVKLMLANVSNQKRRYIINCIRLISYYFYKETVQAVLGVGYTIRHRRHGFEIVFLKMYDKLICLIEFMLIHVVQIMEHKEVTCPNQQLCICRKYNIQRVVASWWFLPVSFIKTLSTTI